MKQKESAPELSISRHERFEVTFGDCLILYDINTYCLYLFLLTDSQLEFVSKDSLNFKCAKRAISLKRAEILKAQKRLNKMTQAFGILEFPYIGKQ